MWKAELGIAAACFLSIASFAKSSVKTIQMVMPGARKAQFLNYPPLPAGIERQQKRNEIKKETATSSHDWGLVNTGFFDVFSPSVQPIRAQVESCSSQVVVAVVDTGIDYTHPELKDSLWINPGEVGYWEPPRSQVANGCRDKSCNGLDDDGNGFADDVVGWDFVNDVPLPYDTHGHGTHIGGIIASRPSEAGVIGICPQVSVMALKYYDNSGIGYNNLQNTVRAFQYAVNNGAHIINYSGGGADPSPSERLAVEEAQKRGVLLVAAAGNDGHNNDLIPYYPASYPLDNIISVASINRQNQLLPSSNFGSRTVHIAAPGLSILSSLPSGRFGTMSGTSQATAFVTGAAALLASQIKQRGPFDYKSIKAWLTESARPLAGVETRGFLTGGILSIPKALQVQASDLKKSYPASSTEIALSPDSGRASTPAGKNQ